jgi:hypothetical protein
MHSRTKKVAGLALSLMIVGAMASAAMGQGKSGNSPAQQGAEIVSSGDLGTASSSYQAANVVDTITLGEGAWQITAAGAINVNAGGSAPNCGLREGTTMLAKQNFATGAFGGRSGFSLVGATEGPTSVDLVCYGTGLTDTPFEYNLVAISGTTLTEF